MEPLECKGDTLFPMAMLLISAFFALVMLAIGCVSGTLEFAGFLIFPLSAVLWLRWRRRYRLVLCPDHMEVHTWRGVESISYVGAVAELRLRGPFSPRGARFDAHQPLLCMRREGRLLASVPRGALRASDAELLVEYFRNLVVEKQFLG